MSFLFVLNNFHLIYMRKVDFSLPQDVHNAGSVRLPAYIGTLLPAGISSLSAFNR